MTFIPLDVAPPQYPRRRQLLYGAAFLVLAFAMFVLTMLGVYWQVRHGQRSTWLAEFQTKIKLTQPVVQLFTLLMGSVTVQWSVWAAMKGDRAQALWGLAITAVLGVAMINQSWFLFANTGLPMDSAEGRYFYGATGGHLAMVAVATLGLVGVLVRMFGGSYHRDHPDGVSAVALFWHATVLLYVPIWLGIYVAK